MPKKPLKTLKSNPKSRDRQYAPKKDEISQEVKQEFAKKSFKYRKLESHFF